MRGRGYAAFTVVVGLAVASGGVALERLGPRPPGDASAGNAPSGAWFCPHGGGAEGWRGSLTLANPGPAPVLTRVSSLGRDGISEPQLVSVPARSQSVVPVAADSAARSTVVEYFGGWVGAGWRTLTRGDRAGLATEPCLPSAGRTWLLPDGTTEEGQETFVVIMNPFDSDAVFTLTLMTEDRQIRTRSWSDYILGAHRSASFDLNTAALGERTVGVEIEASIGRVAAAEVGLAEGGGVRSLAAIPSGREHVILPGVGGGGRSSVAVLNPGEEEAALSVSVLGTDTADAAQGFAEEVLGPATSSTYDLTLQATGALDVRASGDRGVAAIRRTLLPRRADQGATAGAATPRGAWVLLAGGGATVARIVLANPGQDSIEVTLHPLVGEAGPAADPVTVSVPARSTVVEATAPEGLLPPGVSFFAVSSAGSFVPVVALFAGENSYGVAAGIPIPDRWVSQA